MSKDVKLAKVYKGLSDEFSRIAAVRFITGKDKRASPPTVQKKALKHPLWQQIRRDLEIADFVEDKRAQVFNIFTFMIAIFVAILFFAGIIYAHGLLYNVFHQVGVLNDANYAPNATWTNMTAAADLTFGTLNESAQSLKMVAAVYIFALAIAIIITNALIKVNPLWFYAYILLAILAVVFAAPISNAYESLLNSNIFDGILQDFTVANWAMHNLPTLVLVVSMLGGVFLFINLIRNQGEQNLN